MENFPIRKSITILIVGALFTLPACSSSSLTGMAAMANRFPGSTGSFAYLSKPSLAKQQQVLKTYRKTNQTNLVMSNSKYKFDSFDDVESGVLSDESGLDISVDDVRNWIGDDAAAAEIENPDSSVIRDYSNTSEASSNTNRLLEVVLIQVKNKAKAQSFINSLVKTNGFTEKGDAVELKGNYLEKINIDAQCGLYYTGPGSATECSYTNSRKLLTDVNNVLANIKSGHSLNDNSNFRDAIKRTNQDSVLKGYVSPSYIFSKSDANRKCFYSTIGAKDGSGIGYSSDVVDNGFVGDAVLPGAGNIPQGKFPLIRNLPENTIFAGSFYDIGDIIQRAAVCVAGNTPKLEKLFTLGQEQYGLTALLDSLKGEVDYFVAGTDYRNRLGVIAHVDDVVAAKKSLDGIAALANGFLVRNGSNALAVKPDGTGGYSGDLFGSDIHFGVIGNRMIFTSSSELYAELKQEKPNTTWVDVNPEIKAALAGSEQDSFALGLLSLKFLESDTQESVNLPSAVSLRLFQDAGNAHLTGRITFSPK